MADRRCPIRNYPCPEHDFMHGHEAEELRAGIEQLIKDYERRVPVRELQALLDRVDARDSLAFQEASDEEPSDENARLREAAARLDALIRRLEQRLEAENEGDQSPEWQARIWEVRGLLDDLRGLRGEEVLRG